MLATGTPFRIHPSRCWAFHGLGKTNGNAVQRVQRHIQRITTEIQQAAQRAAINLRARNLRTRHYFLRHRIALWFITRWRRSQLRGNLTQHQTLATTNKHVVNVAILFDDRGLNVLFSSSTA